MGLSRERPVASSAVELPEKDEVLDFSTTDIESDINDDREDDFDRLECTSIPVGNEALLTLELASAKLGANILQTLDARFKGKLSEVRRLDERDLIF